MGAENWFSLSALPVLDPPPAEPPLGLDRLMDRVPAGRPKALARCIILSDDLLQREAVLAGELPNPEPAVLTVEQVSGDAALPDELGPSAERAAPPPRLASDAIWHGYYRWAATLARRQRSRFLWEWVRWEVTTRNALAVARARVLGVDPESYRVARWLSAGSADADRLAEAWASAPHPLDGFRALLAGRWRWADRHGRYFTFEDDEFASYTVKLVLLHRWLRASELGPRRYAEGTGEVRE